LAQPTRSSFCAHPSGPERVPRGMGLQMWAGVVWLGEGHSQGCPRPGSGSPEGAGFAVQRLVVFKWLFRHLRQFDTVQRMTRNTRAPVAWGAIGRASAWMLGGLCGVCAATSAEAADIKGTLSGYEHLRNPVWAEARLPENHGYSFREPVATVPVQLRQLFPLISKEICVVALGEGGKEPKPLSVRVAGGRTTPVTVVVLPGTELRFKNSDPFEHRLFGVGSTVFPAAGMASGSVRKWTVQGNGTFEIRDELAPSLRTWVVADARVAGSAHPNDDGKFSIEVDGPGQYTIQAYFAGAAVGPARTVNVGNRDVDISASPLVLATEPPREPASEADKNP
jgi:hypothetical protein